jgi:hypothetical protein
MNSAIKKAKASVLNKKRKKVVPKNNSNGTIIYSDSESYSSDSSDSSDKEDLEDYCPG